ncbi:MAG: DUF4249 domain-containing protein, partial [Flavobacteriales bacterium]
MFGILTSCIDTIDVDVPNGGARLVVEASINWEKGTTGATQIIKLSESTAFFSPNVNVPVTGAYVKVTNDENGMHFIFNDQNNGDYIATDFIPQLNKSYTLEIRYNGEVYTANETLMPVSTINTVEQKTLENGLEEEIIQLRVFFDDPAGIENYYLGEFIDLNLSSLSLVAISDEFTDGNESFIEYYDENIIISKGKEIAINIYGISENYFNYISLLIEQGSITGPFTTIPVQLKGNCINSNNPNEEV